MKGNILIACILVSATMYAQSFEEQFRTFQQKATKSYTDFRDESNQKYADFIRSSWERCTQSPAISQPEEKPVPPVVYNKDQDQKQNEIKVDVVPMPQSKPTPQPIAPIEENVTPSNKVSITYLGTEFTFRVPQQPLKLTKTDNETIAQLWKAMSSEAYDNLIYDCLESRNTHHLCDWAYIELTGTLANQLYGTTNEANLLQGYILAQSGYTIRLAQGDNNKIYVLAGSNYQIFQRNYFEIDGVYFYPLEKVQGSMQICSAKFDNEQPFSLYINDDQTLSLDEEMSSERQSELGIVATSIINLNTIQFYNDYPTGQVNGDCGTRWAMYANAPMEECVKESLYPTLMQAIQGESEEQAVNALLNWVQSAFEYEYDDKVWGHDRAFFPSETLYYPYADCEDRSILFSRIVRDLLGLKVVLIYYPGHLATAVAFHEDVEGDFVQLNDTKYIVCDPTYIGAPVGMTMPDLDNQTAKLIRLQ